MPIRPEMRHRYPKDWQQIRARIRQRAAAQGPDGVPRCEWCDKPDGAEVICLWDGTGRWQDPAGNWRDARGRYILDPDASPRVRHRTRVVLTTAHLDHTPENNLDANLACLCQGCHLRWDARLHVTNAKQTRRYRPGQLPLPEIGQRPTVTYPPQKAELGASTSEPREQHPRKDP